MIAHREDCPPVRVLLVISSLERGGAERQVVQLANYLPRGRFEVAICSLSSLVPLAEGLHDRSQLHVIEKRWRFDVGLVPRVAELMRALRTNVVHAFLPDAEIVARLAARLAGAPVVIASERNTDYQRPLSHTVAMRATRSFFDVMIANSHAGRRFNMRTLDLPGNRIEVVHNGVDVELFRPVEGDAVRRGLGIGVNDRVIGMVASFKKQKNHALFFEVAAVIGQKYPNCYFWCVGEPLRDNQQGAGDYHQEMRRLVRESRLESRVMFLGKRDDMAAVYSACDLTLLTSTREGTPNVLLESMACGVPVVATDVADNARVVPDGRTGYIVPLGDAGAMIARVDALLADDAKRRAMGSAARAWVETEFSIAALIRKTGTIYETWLRRKRRCLNGCG